MLKLRHRASVVCVQDEHLLLVELSDPESGIKRWFLPGGKIEAGETPEQAAMRETWEETGYQVTVLAHEAQVLDYDFYWAGVHVPCRTHFFVASLSGSQDESPEGLNCQWLGLNEVATVLSYHPRVLAVILDLVQTVIKRK